MPIRLQASDDSHLAISSSTARDLLSYCIAPSVSHAVMFAGVARVFTSINPIGAAITGAIVPICDYVIDKILPNLNCTDGENTDYASRYAFTRLSGYVLGTLAATAMEFPITLTQALLLSAGSNFLMFAIATTVVSIAASYFSARRFFGHTTHMIGIQCGHPILALEMLVWGAMSGMINVANSYVSEEPAET